MECYFYAEVKDKRADGLHNAVISFAVPDVGIVFRSRFAGSPAECEYASLLTLLEFVELNPQVFRDRTIEVYGDSFTVVNQINEKMYCNKDLQPFRNMAMMFRNKFSYSLNWIPQRENPATLGLASD